jgi:hypothetical protein
MEEELNCKLKICSPSAVAVRKEAIENENLRVEEVEEERVRD